MKTDDVKKAMLYMTMYAMTHSIVLATVRFLSEELSSGTLLFFRSFFGLITILPLIIKQKIQLFKTHQLKLHLLRGIAAFLGGLATFYSLATIPLTLVVSITFSAPLFASLFAYKAMNENITRAKVISLVMGLIGVLVLLRPAITSNGFGVLAAFLAAIMTAMAFITVKKLSTLDAPNTVMVLPFVLLLPASGLMAILDWTAPSLTQLPFLLMLGLGVSVSQYCMVKAFSLAEASALLPIDFIKLIIACAIGTLIFGDKIDEWSIAGGTIILIGTFVLFTNKRLPKESSMRRR